jgi:predicted nucleic acid-binding protein
LSLVLDASVAVHWFLTDEGERSASTLLDRVIVRGAYVPALFRWEFQSGLLRAERARRLAGQEVDAARDAIRGLPIVVEPPGESVRFGLELQLARHYALTVHDAAYLSLAVSHGMPLATLDAELARAAIDLNVEVLP